MLKFSLNLTWDVATNKWVVTSTDFGEVSGDPDSVSDIHVLNMAMSQTLKIFEVLDTPVTPISITVVPGQPTAN